MAVLHVNNYIIDTPLVEILYRVRLILNNGKLRDIDDSVDDIKVTCPNDDHEGGCENRPDCHINLSENKSVPYGFFHCFACDAKGSFVHFLALCFSSTDAYAQKWLITNYGKLNQAAVSLGEDIKAPVKNFKKTLNPAILESYQHWCPYLQKRKISREISEMFGVRYDPIYRQVIFPVYDVKNRLIMLAKRSIDTKTFYLDKDMDKEVYNLNYIMNNNINTCLITEGPFDCLTAYEYGYPAVATLGAISDYQIEQINKSCIRTLYLMFDNDAAGQRFADKLKSKLAKRILTVDVKLPAGKKDINELSKEEMDLCIKNAKEKNIL